jgi:hypothetical protein
VIGGQGGGEVEDRQEHLERERESGSGSGGEGAGAGGGGVGGGGWGAGGWEDLVARPCDASDTSRTSCGTTDDCT